MNIRHNVDIGEVGEALKELADKADAQDQAIAAAEDAAEAYAPGAPTDWAGTPPATVAEALDRLAALVKSLNSGTGA